ncbi:uncharacterized protein LOC133664635 isoform X4 [Entelurus aequoreus]|uniref:uncharacterized protein LOC133664635 isoform X4 n=1 Tax=Entelurus aequoreus TaxID=161455 RepID=UPI002B1E7BF7|nr:uncharacterized protein LOC133664635 isoform X4 [Entelurus aequoreus]
MCERTITEYEEELCPTKEENGRQHQLVDADFKKHKVVLHRKDVCQPPHIKEEEEECRTTQEEECLLGQEEAEPTKFPLTVVSVKTEEHEDKPPESSQLHHSPDRGSRSHSNLTSQWAEPGVESSGQKCSHPPRSSQRTNMDEEKFIIEVQDHKVIYDATHPFYKDNGKKDLAWNTIAGVMDVDVNICKAKWRALRDSFVKSRKKSVASGSAGGPQKEWKYADIMSFLVPHLQPRRLPATAWTSRRMSPSAAGGELHLEAGGSTVPSD